MNALGGLFMTMFFTGFYSTGGTRGVSWKNYTSRGALLVEPTGHTSAPAYQDVKRVNQCLAWP
jgi:hypothetical protein